MGESTVSIRKAQPGDYIALHALNQNSLGYPYDIDKTRVRLAHILTQESDAIFVAERDAQILGYAHGAHYDCLYANPLKNILAIAVDEDHQGLGVGRLLLAAIEEWAMEQGAAGVRLVSGYNRTGAHQFYLACGYRDRKDQKNFIKVFE